MAGIYVHIPFCKQKCHYCDFHFSTNLARQQELVDAIIQEIELQKETLTETVNTIYFGGGTPSLLTDVQLNAILSKIYESTNVAADAELTFECNPDDLDAKKLNLLKNAGINRLSIGIQSFSEDVLQLMNRAHNAPQADQVIKLSQDAGFDNITADLIYGVPNRSLKEWEADVQQMISYSIPHISAYCLTIEPNTYFQHLVNNNQLELPSDESSLDQFKLMINALKDAGLEQYEISNFAVPGFESKHNSAYWLGEKYLGIGPSAHSFDGAVRSWNVNNNPNYIQSIQKGVVPSEKEVLSHSDKINEYILTRLRTKWGVKLEWLQNELDSSGYLQMNQKIQQFVSEESLKITDGKLLLTEEGKFIADHLAAELFV